MGGIEVPTPAANAQALYEAVAALSSRTAEAYTQYESNGCLYTLRDDLAWIRDRANSIQDATIGTITAIETNL